MASTIESPSLRNQFELLQKKQQDKLEKRKNKTSEKEQGKKPSNSSASRTFGVDDDLDLKLAIPPSKDTTLPLFNEDLVDKLQNDTRQLTDENGRLYKLLSEKDFEVQKYKKKLSGLEAVGELSGVTSEHAASKIVELSKKIRELNVEMEKEKTKARQMSKKCLDLEKELQLAKTSPAGDSVKRQVPASAHSLQFDAHGYPISQGPSEAEVKELQDKLRQAELKVSEYRNQNQLIKKELNMANKVVEQEVGEGANVQQLLNNTSGWRGRAEQIIALQKKVNELKYQQEFKQVDSSRSVDDLNLDSGRTKRSAVTRQIDQLKKTDKERREAMEKQNREMKAVEADYELQKAKIEGFKARSKALSDENKRLKTEIQNVISKSDVDDQLIQKLSRQLEDVKQAYQEERNRASEMKGRLDQSQQQDSIRAQQESNIVAQLQQIITTKDEQIKKLEQGMMHQPQLAWESRQSSSLSFTSTNTPVQITAAVMENHQSGKPPTPQPEMSARSVSSRDFYTQNVTNNQVSEQAASIVMLKEELDQVRCQCQEYKSLGQAASVERDKQTELVQLLQNRAADASEKLQEAQNEVLVLKRKNVDLERKLGRAGIQDKSQSAMSSRRAQSKTIMSSRGERGDLDSTTSQENLQTQLDIQRDENQALKLTMKKSLESKEQEVKVYKDMLEQTKTIFLQGLRQYRQQHGS